MPCYTRLSDAGRTLARASRVLVIGCSGGGKTTLSRRIATALGLPYRSIDRDVRWLPGWRERDRGEQREILANLVREERWVIDGSGASTFDIRLPRAELVLWVRVPRHRALIGLARRVARHHGSVRPDMADGCPEPLPGGEFLSYIWNFERRYAPEFVRSIDRFGPNVPLATLRSHAQMDELLRTAREARDDVPHSGSGSPRRRGDDVRDDLGS